MCSRVSRSASSPSPARIAARMPSCSFDHAAVVAREYGLPAVVGAHLATSRIADGSRVTLDGTTGDVWIG